MYYARRIKKLAIHIRQVVVRNARPCKIIYRYCCSDCNKKTSKKNRPHAKELQRDIRLRTVCAFCFEFCSSMCNMHPAYIATIAWLFDVIRKKYVAQPQVVDSVSVGILQSRRKVCACNSPVSLSYMKH